MSKKTKRFTKKWLKINGGQGFKLTSNQIALSLIALEKVKKNKPASADRGCEKRLN